MTKQLAVVGSLIDCKNINVHKSVRLSIDVPAEQAAAIIAMFGWPTQVNPVPVAVARLNPAAPIASKSDTGQEATGSQDDAGNGKESSPSPPKSLAQQAGILCNDARFQAFMKADGSHECAEAIRLKCGVKSRAEIVPLSPAADKWFALLERFRGWQAAERSGAI